MRFVFRSAQSNASPFGPAPPAKAVSSTEQDQETRDEDRERSKNERGHALSNYWACSAPTRFARSLWREMEGYTNDEIAKRHGVSPRSVERKLRLIRKTWELLRRGASANESDLS